MAYKMKGSPFQRNFGIGKKIQKLWDKYGPNINPYTKTEKFADPIGEYSSITRTTKSPGWGKTKKRTIKLKDKIAKTNLEKY